MESNFNILKTQVINLSESTTWESAVKEWVLDEWDEDNKSKSECVCGKRNIRYLFTIRNIHNNNELGWIGSECIKKFNRTDFDDLVTIRLQLQTLFEAIKKNEPIQMTSKFFSRRLLKYFFDKDIFKPSIYNDQKPEKDYSFLVNVFNKGIHKQTPKQEQKTWVLINKTIVPFICQLMKNKMN